MSVAVVVFAKAPVPNQVKTRLVPPLSAQQACELHCRMLVHALTIATGSGLCVELWSSQPHPFLSNIVARLDVPLFVQRGETLGERMQNAMRAGLGRYQSVIIIGSDCPALTVDYLRAAEQALTHTDVVLGPARDGGYVLIGCRQVHPELFLDIAWGTGAVLLETRQRINAAGLRHMELAVLEDVDRPEDLIRARSQWPQLFAGI